MGMPLRTILVSYSVHLAAMIPFLLGCSSPAQVIQPFTSSCGTDNEISAKEREAADQAALQFVQYALGPNPAVAYSAFTADAKQSVTSEKFGAMFQQGIQRMGPFKDLHVATHPASGARAALALGRLRERAASKVLIKSRATHCIGD